MSQINFSSSAPVATTNLNANRSTQAARVFQSPMQDSGKIDKAARDFESILIGEWLEKAEKSFASVPGADADKNNDPGHDQFQSIGCQFLAEGLSKAGGIGIASMISKHLKTVEAQRDNDPAGPAAPKGVPKAR
ncbi:MAG TPA: rod-binding protein [Terriglobales bacterium]|nr:rod-binding protein [Terriglobales bacterium]